MCRQEKCAAQRTITTEQSGGTRRSLFIALGHRTLGEPQGSLGVSEMEGGPNIFRAIGRILNGETNGKYWKRSNPLFQGTFICIYCCLVLSQLEIIFSPMNKLGKDLKSSVHGLQKLLTARSHSSAMP